MYFSYGRWVMADVLVVSNFHRTTNINLTNVRIQACHFIPNKFHAFLPATWRKNGKLSGQRYSHNRGQEIGRGRTLIRKANVWKCNMDYNMVQNNFFEDKDVNMCFSSRWLDVWIVVEANSFVELNVINLIWLI